MDFGDIFSISAPSRAGWPPPGFYGFHGLGEGPEHIFQLPDMFFEELDHAPRLFTLYDAYKHVASRTGHYATVYDTRDTRAFSKDVNYGWISA